MKKIKFDQIELQEGNAYYEDCLINLEQSFFNLFDFNDRNDAKTILFEYDYIKDIEVSYLNSLIYTNCLSNFCRLKIVEDENHLNKCDESYYVYSAKMISDIFNIEIGSINSHKYDFDIKRLEKIDEYSYNLGNVQAIKNNKITEYFRHALIIENTKNIVLLNTSTELHEYEGNHKCVTFNITNDEILKDYLEEYGVLQNINSTYNRILAELLDEDFNDFDKLNKLCVRDITKTYTLSSKYLILVELISMKSLNPSLLFKEVFKYGNDKDINYCLNKLSFRNIEE